MSGSGEALARTTWFDALHSRRRAAMVAEVATRAYVPFQGDGVRRHEWPVFKQHLPRWRHHERLWRQ
jgi:hypothetical protein